MILDRFVTEFLSFFLPSKHTVVLTVIVAVPLFPTLIKWLLEIPWTINGNSVRRKFTMLEALVCHTSSLLTFLNTCSGIQEISYITIIGMGAKHKIGIN